MSRPRASGRPRYAVVAQALTEDIISGRYPVGATLPTEQALCALYDISRHTTREALRRLQMLGLVTRRAGVGTLVKSNRISQRYLQVGDTVSDLYQYAQDMALQVLEVTDIEADADTAALLGCAKGQAWRKLRGVRLKDGVETPVALIDAYIGHAYREVVDDIEGGDLPMWSLIEARYGIALEEVRQQITAVRLGQSDAKNLASKEGDPALQITRHYQTKASEVYLVAINLYPAERFSYANTLQVERVDSYS